MFVENNVVHHLHKLYTHKTILGHEEEKKIHTTFEQWCMTPKNVNCFAKETKCAFHATISFVIWTSFGLLVGLSIDCNNFDVIFWGFYSSPNSPMSLVPLSSSSTQASNF